MELESRPWKKSEANNVVDRVKRKQKIVRQ